MPPTCRSLPYFPLGAASIGVIRVNDMDGLTRAYQRVVRDLSKAKVRYNNNIEALCAMRDRLITDAPPSLLPSPTPTHLLLLPPLLPLTSLSVLVPLPHFPPRLAPPSPGCRHRLWQVRWWKAMRKMRSQRPVM